MQSLYPSQSKRRFVAVANVNMRFSIVFLYIIVDLAIALPRTSGLLPWSNITEESICTELIPTTTTLFVSYLETYTYHVMNVFPRRRSRINYRVDYQHSYHPKKICCKGYQEVSNKCTPICSPECVNGICKAPNLCECPQGYVKTSSSIRSSNICEPVCSNYCINGHCFLPELCVCLPNYWLDSDGYNCRPTCDVECESNHGYCLEPHTCICHNGYKKSNETNICEPICESECVNGKCVKPNVCSCNDGYQLDVTDSFICKAKCDKICIFGTCTAPNVCTCDQGFELGDSWNICKPICSQQCLIGICIAPEVCSCLDGFALSETSRYVCEPICGHACGNGTCISPNTCKCDEGFVLQEGDVTVAACNPFCPSPCGPDAECTAPDRCSCRQGYRAVDKNGTMDEVLASRNTTCVPVCVNDCVNGKCVSPDVCVCDDGYTTATSFERDINYCQAICKKSCGPNGKCDAPNSCVCNEGYHNVTTRDEVYVCQPFCESNCENGKCTNPNFCTCNMGYERDERNRCVPVCYPACTNGTCTEPNICRCDEGFILRNETICEPFCENGCTNGTCIAPNTCQCNENFVEIKSNDTSICVPACSRNCSGHGTCYNQSNACDCFYGWTGWDCQETNVCVYKMNEDSHFVSSVTVINGTNGTLMETYDNAPLCYQCSDSLNNETLCFLVQSDESLTIPTVGCFLSTKLPCYERPHHNAFRRSIHVTVSLLGVTIAIVAIAAVAGYAIVRKRRRQEVALANVQPIALDDPDTEALIIT